MPPAGECVVQLVGLVNGGATPYDGQWLVKYDPTRPGVDPWRRPMDAIIICTDDRSKARVFFSFVEVYEYLQQTTERPTRRPDGKPDRPITAFTVTIEPL